MSKIKFFLTLMFAPIFIFLIINCTILVNQLKVLKSDSSIWVQLSVVFSLLGIGFFIYYLYKSIKNKLFIINIANDRVMFITSYASVLTVISSMIMGYESIMPVITFGAGNFTNLFIILYFFNVSRIYEREFPDEFKLLYSDSKYQKWFLLFSKSMFSLNVKFNDDGVMVNNSYIEKDSIKYYEDLFDKRLTKLSQDELKLVEMNAI